MQFYREEGSDEIRSGRVLMIVPQPFFTLRGSPMRVRSTAESLARLGLSVDLLVLPLGDDIEMKGVRLLRCWKIPGISKLAIGPSWPKLLYDINISLTALARALVGRYDVFHGIEEGGIIAAVLSFILRKPCVYDMHSCMSAQIHDRHMNAPLEKSVKLLEYFAVKQASGVITVGEDISDYARSISPNIPVSAISDLPITGKGAPCVEATAALREEYGVHSKKVLLYTGNFYQYQGVELLLDGFAAATKGWPDDYARLIIVGGDPEQEREKREALESQARALGIAQQVIFAGQHGVEKMGAFMALADALISPRISGANTPLKIYSYMASGKPVIATRISSHTQVLNDSLAILCEPTTDGVAQGIRYTLEEDPTGERTQHLETLAQSAERTLWGKHGPEEFVKRLRLLYTPLLPLASKRRNATPVTSVLKPSALMAFYEPITILLESSATLLSTL